MRTWKQAKRAFPEINQLFAFVKNLKRQTMNILPLPVKTEIAVNFKHTFRYDSQLAKDFYDDFMEDVPLLTLEYGLGGVFSRNKPLLRLL